MSTATGPQLERELNNGASLFLTRISAWLRLTYLLGHDLALQLKALGVFVSASSGNRYAYYQLDTLIAFYHHDCESVPNCS